MFKLELEYRQNEKLWVIYAIDSNGKIVVNLSTTNREVAGKVADYVVKEFIADTIYHATSEPEHEDD
jgi:hypothetical protein